MNLHFDLFDLKLFAYVADARSLTRGADKACISLAAASTRIKQMEEAIGGKLLHRNAQGVTLTAAGEALLYHAKRVMQQMEHLRIDMQDFGKGIKGHVRVFANTTSITEYLPEKLAGFLTRHPAVQVDLREYLSEEIVRSVADGGADIGILAGDVHTGDFDARPFGRNQLVLVVPATHRFAGAESIAFVDTLEEQHVGLHHGSAIHRFLQRKAELAGRGYSPRIQVGSFEAICLMIEAGVGVGVLPASSARRLSRALRITTVALADAWAERELKIVARDREQLPASARELFDYLAS
ncbi:LysR family transcriptional regulator [Variovorax sp. J22P240]|uniref:LysR family transcriptional regulator n=1 Tax=unclassified Variovorax TaxID=663243 RepID=UPI002579120D|nr:MULTISPECIES: LysR family transcriptional regulator [unclassified Variovorax]MDL9998555.1 LysR family transcriptional regulator [Variovorax sp. J22P240]MDM0052036.1 LysR family transcriptional regulator [Variovorax sp. J22R115]